MTIASGIKDFLTWEEWRRNYNKVVRMKLKTKEK